MMTSVLKNLEHYLAGQIKYPKECDDTSIESGMVSNRGVTTSHASQAPEALFSKGSCMFQVQGTYTNWFKKDVWPPVAEAVKKHQNFLNTSTSLPSCSL